MALILQSNKIATASLGNIFGYEGPMNFDAILDFSNGIYRYRSGDEISNASLSEALEFSRSSAAEYIDVNGATQIAALNQPRIHTFTDIGVTGLLLEGAETNLVANPNSPATQVVNVPVVANNDTLIVLSVEGSGSATLSGAGITTAAANPAIAGRSTAAQLLRADGTTPVTVTVTGTLTRMKLSARLPVTGSSKTSTFLPAGVETRAEDSARLSSLLLSAGLTREAGTIIAGYAEPYDSLPAAAGQRTLFALRDSTQPQGGLYVHQTAKTTASNIGVNPGTNKTAKTYNMPVANLRRGTFALAYSGSGAETVLAQNGIMTVNTTPFEQSQPDQLWLGSYNGFQTYRSAWAVLTHLVLYKRRLTNAEIAAATMSWL